MRSNRARRHLFAVAACLCIAASSTARAQLIEDDNVLRNLMVTSIVAHDVAIPAGLIPSVILNYTAESVEFSANLLLKAYRPLFTPPPDIGPLMPNTVDQCGYQFVVPAAQAEFENILGIITIRRPLGKWNGQDDPLGVDPAEVARIEACLEQNIPGGAVGATIADAFPASLRLLCGLPPNNWGILGPPARAWHANTGVVVSVAGPGIQPIELPQIARLPPGVHRMEWVAETQLSPIFDIAVPAALLATGVLTEVIAAKWTRQIADALDGNRLAANAIEEAGEVAAEGAEGAARVARFDRWKRKLRNIIIKKAIKSQLPGFSEPSRLTERVVDELLGTVTTAFSSGGQFVSVYDVFPPTIATSQPLVPIEATDFGGARTSRSLGMLNDSITVTEECDRDVRLTNDLPEFLPIGTHVITWRVEDLGPNPGGQTFFDEVEQTLVVADTQDPIMLAPPSKVIETPAGQIDLATAAIGFAVAVDLADPQPEITHDAPASFDVDTRTLVTWTAIDDSLNDTQQTQLVTVKAEGTNNPPVADDTSATTLTSQPIPITLTASDPDELDGRFDPVWFSITDRPDHGEFVAPLYPFFIEDYRTDPTGGLGPGFIGNEIGFMDDQFCSQGLEPPHDFVREPLYVHVTDQGVRFVLDHYYWCNDPVEYSMRLSWWNSDGEFVTHLRLDPDSLTNESFVVDRNGDLYFLSQVGGGSSSTELQLQRCGLATGAFVCNQLWRFDSSTAPSVDAGNLSYARVDSARGIAYFTDRTRVYAFDLDSRSYLGLLVGRDLLGDPVENILGGSCSISGVPSAGGFGMEVDSEGNLYVADSCAHQIHKFGPPTVDETGAFVAGEHIGWLGGCSTSTNNACDDTKQRSKGYSCTRDTCTATFAGGLQGQFDHPLFLALGPNDILYVADYDNFRIQRFAPDGSFAGEAASEGTGINQGERPGFVLGNIGRPRALSVNSSQFHIVDRDEEFLHVFGTLPFTDVTDHSATVTYVSRTTFHSDTDQFAFRVSDGLAESEPATVTIQVDRNFRPPTAIEARYETDEDVPLVDFVLEGDDPDGIFGVDFNGLDTLTFEIQDLPEHGILTGADAQWTYTPDPGFVGEDALRFTVDDGVFQSEPATVELHVLPMNDPPEVTIVSPGPVGRGFPILIEGTFLDEPSEAYTARIVWGDGGMDVTGELTEDGLTGVAILDSGTEGVESMTLARHDYQALGMRDVLLCVTDFEGAEGCDGLTVAVEDLVRLGLSATIENGLTEIADGTPFAVVTELANGQPSVGGRNAENVTLVATVDPELSIQGVSSSTGSCSFTPTSAECSLGTLPPTDVAETITLTLVGPGDLIYDRDPSVELEATTTTPATGIAETTVEIDVIADTTDSDGDGMSDRFETAFGLDSGFDDSAGDLDGDGLSNLREYEARTNALASDTDADGLDDGAEADELFTDPLLADSDRDGIPDGWEIENGLQPLIDDADLDPDLDGQTNLEEYLAMTLPQDRDDDGILDFEDNCFLANPLQEDSDGNGIGDACDCRPTPFPGCLNPDPVFATVEATPANDPDSNGFGAVDYPYGLSTSEVTNAEYRDFLEAVASSTDPNELYSPAMAMSPQGGIVRMGDVGAYAYVLKPNMANKPVNFVSWLDAARFVNWLENGRPSGMAAAGSTETGAFDLTVVDPATMAPLDPNAMWSLPTEDEWYKAAYFEPPARYYLYPTGADIEPRPIVPDDLGNALSGDVNYFDGSTAQPVGLVSVMSGEPGSESPWGTWDQGGNVAEWLGSDAEGGLRIARGGSFRNDHLAFLSHPSPERSTVRFDPLLEADDLGFRVVRIPEPGRLLLEGVALATALATATWRRRRARDQGRKSQTRS